MALKMWNGLLTGATGGVGSLGDDDGGEVETAGEVKKERKKGERRCIIVYAIDCLPCDDDWDPSCDISIVKLQAETRCVHGNCYCARLDTKHDRAILN